MPEKNPDILPNQYTSGADSSSSYHNISGNKTVTDSCISSEVEAKDFQPKIDTIVESRRFAVNVVAGGGVNIVKILMQLALLPVMAHLLGPNEFGVYALALPTISFFMTLADGGLGASLAREPLESEDVWSSAFWLMLIAGVSLSIIVSGWGIILAQISAEPRVLGVMRVLSVIFILVALSVLPIARLTRERRLVVISGADLAGNLIGALVAVLLAYSGAGAMSLAAQYVITFFVRAIILNLFAFVRPKLIFRYSTLANHISTGSSLVCGRLADFSGRLTENLLFGRIFGPSSLGTYTFASQVTRFVCEAASGPVWGALYAQALRQSGHQTERLHIKLVHLLALVLAPVAFLASACAPGLIILTLGPTWKDAATIISILIPFYALNVIAAQGGAILLARGAGWTNFFVSLFQVVSRILAVLLGLSFSVIGVTWALAGTLILYSIFITLSLRRLQIYVFQAQLKAILAPTMAGASAWLAYYTTIQVMPFGFNGILLSLFAGFSSYLVLLVILEGKQLLVDIRGLTRLMGR